MSAARGRIADASDMFRSSRPVNLNRPIGVCTVSHEWIQGLGFDTVKGVRLSLASQTIFSSLTKTLGYDIVRLS